MNEALVDVAIRAIQDVFEDGTVVIEDTLSGLTSIRHELDMFIEMIEKDISAQD